MLVDGALEDNFSGALMMGFGVSVVVAAFFLSRQKDIKRMFAYSSVEHMGIMTFAFGMGGAVAAFAGLLHMTVHSLTKSAIFFTVGHASRRPAAQDMASIRGLIQQPGDRMGPRARQPRHSRHTTLRRVHERVHGAHHRDAREHSWATPFTCSLGVAFAAVFGKVQPMVFGETTAERVRIRPPWCRFSCTSRSC